MRDLLCYLALFLCPAIIQAQATKPLEPPTEAAEPLPQVTDVWGKPQRIAPATIRRWLDVTLTETEGKYLWAEEKWDTGTVVTTMIPYSDIIAVGTPRSGKSNPDIFRLKVTCIHAIHQDVHGEVGTGIATGVEHFQGPENEFQITLVGSGRAEAMYRYLSLRQTAEIRADCSEDGRKSCLSFNEMLKARDKELFSQVLYFGDATYVCFRPDDSVAENSFFVLHYHAPEVDHWRTVKDTKIKWLLNNHLYIESYVNGTSDDSRKLFMVRLKWNDPSNANYENGVTAPVQDSLGDGSWRVLGFLGRPTVTIRDSEITVGYSYKNPKNQTVDYDLRIRKATGRFLEAYVVRNPHWHDEDTGYCARFGRALK